MRFELSKHEGQTPLDYVQNIFEDASSPDTRWGLTSLWLYEENNKLRDWKMYLLYIFPLSATHFMSSSL
jgi:hypothetical protein